MSNRSNDSNPYPGPRPFTPSEVDLFFGRAGEARQFLPLLIAQPIVLLYSPSGAGKSSFLNTQLRGQILGRQLEVFFARIKAKLPREIDSESIANLPIFNALTNLMAVLEVDIPLSILAEESLSNFVGKYLITKPSRNELHLTVLVFDQFEELFTCCPGLWEKWPSFFEQVSEALKEHPALRVIFSIREEFLAQVEQYAPLVPGNFRGRFRLDRLDKEAALDAMRMPLERRGYWFGEGAGEYLLDELMRIRVVDASGVVKLCMGNFAEPLLLQVVCRYIWTDHWKKKRDRRAITIEEVKEFGNVQQALIKFYEDALKAAARASGRPPEEIGQWCEHALVTMSRTRNSIMLEKDTTKGMPNERTV